MKLNVLSDLHLGVGALETPLNDADVVILAGDIGAPRHALSWALRLGKPVIYVAGNHEFYGGSIDGTPRALRRMCAGTAVRVLHDDACVIGNVRFLGTPLWTDFGLFGEGAQRTQAVQEAQRLLRDFSRIRRTEDGEALFTPDDSAALFAGHAAWLQARLAEPHDGPTVVVTHHAPSPRSIHPRFAGSLLNACFVSEAEHLLDGARAGWWVHGHTHDSFDYTVNGTRVVCNPRGYAKHGVNENAHFDPDFIIEVN